MDMVVDCINDYLIEFTCIDRVDGEEKVGHTTIVDLYHTLTCFKPTQQTWCD